MSFYPEGQNYMTAEEFPHFRELYGKDKMPFISSRGPASDLLKRVAQHGSYGSFPHEISCEELGYALARIVMNSDEEEPLAKIIRGWMRFEQEHRMWEKDSAMGVSKFPTE